MTDHVSRPNDRFVARARTVSRAASAVVILLGALALAGWTFDIAFLKGFYAGITMKANTAVSLLLSGASLWLLGNGGHRIGSRRAGQACAALAGAIGAATLSQHLFGWNLGIDELLFTEEPGAVATASPGRMGPPAATSFALGGLALLLLHERRLTSVAQLSAVGIGLMALLALTGYAYGVEPLYGVAQYTGIALITAIALLVLSVGLLAAVDDRGIASVLAGDRAGSLMARRLLVFAILVPLLLGWVRIQLERAGYFDVRFGIAALILSLIVILTALIVHTAILLNRVERQQLVAEATVRDRLHEIETMMEVLPVGVFIARDASARQIEGNRAARELLRVPEPSDNLSLSAPTPDAPKHFRVFHHGVEVAPEDLPVQRAARDGVATQDLELEVVFADGSVGYELISALPLLDEGGSPRGAVAAIVDITARKAAEREREEILARERVARAEAESANRAKDEFLAVMSHELRTPLNAILGWVAVLRDGAVVDQTTMREALVAIERNSRHQTQLIGDLLDVSRIIAGKLQIEVEPLDVGDLVRAATDVVRPASEAKNIQLRLVLNAQAILVRGDAARLQQVVLNLLTNAVEFSSAGGSIEVRVERDAAEAAIVVADDGEGIDPDLLPHVFERFRQGDVTKARRHGGLGLGLSIARNLVEMHGGTIEAASDGVGRGARLTVRLPLL